MRTFHAVLLLALVTGCAGADGAATESSSQGEPPSEASAAGSSTEVGSSPVADALSDTGLLPLIERLPVREEPVREGYDREAFEHWVDDDGDGCNTRCEVLEQERRFDLPGLASGGWWSAYDGYSTDDPGELDIDHLVPLAEAFDSGADTWDAARRRSFANDIDDPAALIAVTAATNRSKSDQDPADWQPPNRDHWCTYVFDWVTVKYRWGLSVDPDERTALVNMAAGCPSVVAAESTGNQVTSSAPSPAVSTSAVEVYFADCASARSAGVAPLRRDDPGYRPGLDRDSDGVACESPSAAVRRGDHEVDQVSVDLLVDA